MTIRGRNIRVLIREAKESSPSDVREISGRLRLPTLDERVSLYLHAVHGKRDFTTQEYFDARDMILNAMAADIAAKSGGAPLATSRDDDSEAALAVTPIMAVLTHPRTEVGRRDHQSTAMGVVVHCLRDQVPDSTRDETALARAPARRLTTRRISISIFAAAAAASVALLSFAVLPIVWRPADQNSSGSRLALAPMAPPEAAVAPSVAAGDPGAAVAAPAARGTTAATAPNEPKKVRTVTIRPDGSDMSAKPVGAPPPAAPSAAAPAAPKAAAARSGGPISLDPQGGGEPAGATAGRTQTAAAPSRPAPDATSSASGGFVVQLSSQKSESEALSSFRSLQAKFPNELGGRQPIVRRADLGSKGVFYRTLVGPFASAHEASQFCSSYKAAGGQCVVPNN